MPYQWEPIIWSAPPSDILLLENEVHLWRANLDLADEMLARLPVLNDEEAARARRFAFEREQKRFAAARTILRLILGRYLSISPRDVDFVRGPFGKPALCGYSHLHFNQADSGELVIYAVSLHREVGIDVEFTGRISDHEQIVRSYFSPREQREFLSLANEHRQEAFFLGWTRKEAYLKARGEGLRTPLRDFDVTLTPGEPVVLTSQDAARWTLSSFCPKERYLAALVVEGKNFRIHHWEWSTVGLR